MPTQAGSEKQRFTGVVTSRTWAILTTVMLVTIGFEGLWDLFVDGAWTWIKLVALLLGVVSTIDLVRRWSQI